MLLKQNRKKGSLLLLIHSTGCLLKCFSQIILPISAIQLKCCLFQPFRFVESLLKLIGFRALNEALWQCPDNWTQNNKDKQI